MKEERKGGREGGTEQGTEGGRKERGMEGGRLGRLPNGKSACFTCRRAGFKFLACT